MERAERGGGEIHSLSQGRAPIRGQKEKNGAGREEDWKQTHRLCCLIAYAGDNNTPFSATGPVSNAA